MLLEKTASITALQRVSFVVLAAHSLKQEPQIAYRGNMEGIFQGCYGNKLLGFF